MDDNEVITIIYQTLLQGFIDQGYINLSIKQANQPTQQGINTNPTVYFFKVGDKRYGWREAEDSWDSVNNVMVHTENQVYESTFQLSALSIQNPSDVNSITASDLVSIAAGILQSDKTVYSWPPQGLEILRISEIRNPYFKDDRDQFEAHPSFDFIVTYNRTRVTTSPVINSNEVNIYRV